MSKRPTRLELHRLRYQAVGGQGELLSLEDLSDDERRLVSLDFFSRSHGGRLRFDRDAVLAEVLSSWGVMCTHPWDSVEGRRCSVCGSWIIHRIERRSPKKSAGIP